MFFMPSAMCGANIKLTRPLCHELWKMALSVLFFYTLPYKEKTLGMMTTVHAYHNTQKVDCILKLGIRSGPVLYIQHLLLSFFNFHSNSTDDPSSYWQKCMN